MPKDELVLSTAFMDPHWVTRFIDRYAFTQGKTGKPGTFLKAAKHHSALVALRTGMIELRLCLAMGSCNLDRVHSWSAHNFQPGNKRGDNWQEALAHVRVAGVFAAPDPGTNFFRFQQTRPTAPSPCPTTTDKVTTCSFCRDLGLASCYTPYPQAVEKGYVLATITRLQLATMPRLARKKLTWVLVVLAIIVNQNQAKCLVLAAFYPISAHKA